MKNRNVRKKMHGKGFKMYGINCPKFAKSQHLKNIFLLINFKFAKRIIAQKLYKIYGGQYKKLIELNLQKNTKIVLNISQKNLNKKYEKKTLYFK